MRLADSPRLRYALGRNAFENAPLGFFPPPREAKRSAGEEIDVVSRTPLPHA